MIDKEDLSLEKLGYWILKSVLLLVIFAIIIFAIKISQNTYLDYKIEKAKAEKQVENIKNGLEPVNLEKKEKQNE